MSVRILIGDCRERLRELPDASVHCCVTSPPYYGLRDYGVDGQMGLEATPAEFVAGMVEVFREVRRVLRDDGTLWLNIGDSYSTHAAGRVANPMAKSTLAGVKTQEVANESSRAQGAYRKCASLPEKNLLGIPWRVAFALQADGWWLRQDIIWSKPNPMPESVRDRCTKAHEYIFMLSKSPRYYYDAEAIKNPASEAMLQQVRDGYGGADTKDYSAGGAQSASGTKARIIEGARKRADKQRGHGRRHAGFNDRWDQMRREEQLALGSNKRSVWTVATQPFSGAHFATFPPALIEPCILAGVPARCCSRCGAPVQRETERVDQCFDGSEYGKRAVEATGGAVSGGTARSTLGSSNGKATGKRATIGFEPTCSCDAAFVPGTVLDPFAGTGTTAAAAREAGFQSLSIEASADHVRDIGVRLGIPVDDLINASVSAVPVAPAADGQVALL